MTNEKNETVVRVLRWLSEATEGAAPDRVREVLAKTLAERAGLVPDLERRARCHAISGLALDVLNQRAHQQESRVLRETAALVEMLEDASKVAGVSGHYAAALLFALEADPYRIAGPLCSFAAHLDLDPIDGVLGIGRVDFQEEPRARPAAPAPSVPSLDWTKPYRLVADALAVGVPVAQLAHDAERLLDASAARYGRTEGFTAADALLRAALALLGGPSVGFTGEREAERVAGALVVEAVGALEATCAEIDGGRGAGSDFPDLSEEHFGDSFATFGVGEALDAMARSRELRAEDRRELGRACREERAALTLARTA